MKCISAEPHFYIEKLGYAGVNLFFLFLLQNIDCGYSLEPPQRGGSNLYPQSMVGAKIRKISSFFRGKFSILKLNQRTNGPVNAHLRSAAYTNKHVLILWYLTPVQGQMKPLGHFLFSESSIFCPFANFLLAFPFK